MEIIKITCSLIQCICSILIAISAIVALILGAYYYHGKKRNSTYDFIEKQITDLLKMQIEYPNFRREDYFKRLSHEDSKQPKSAKILKYEAYCCMVWNSLETIFEKYGKKKLAKSSFLPAMRVLANRHIMWLVESGSISSYNVKMLAFLIENKAI